MVWFTSPAKEVLNVLFNRILAPYVENLDMNQVTYGIGQGQLTLTNLKLKKGALDKFRLPVDVVEGHLGKFSLSLHWMNLGNQPVEVFVEDVYLLVVPSPASNDDPQEEEERAQAAKADRVKNAELLHFRGVPEQASDSTQSQGLVASLIAKILNNLQVTVKNIHIRYEDKLSVPDHPFSAGLTLASFTAFSVNDQWQPAFIESTAGTIHKLGNLESLAIYFNTDTEILAGLPHEKSIAKFSSLIARDGSIPEHQYVIKPITGEGRITMNNRGGKSVPQFDVQLLFDEIGVILDRNQFRDAVSLLDMFHFYARQHQYRTYKPPSTEFQTNRSRAMMKFAGKAILGDIHERNRRWTWEYFAERRDDRKAYVDLFQKQMLNQLPETSADGKKLVALERKLTYEDIRFYRSIARSQLRKDLQAKKKAQEEKAKTRVQSFTQPAKQSWSSWVWGTSTQSTEPNPDDALFDGTMTEAQRKELYDMLDYNEQSSSSDLMTEPRDALKTKVVAKLKQGSFALQSDVNGKSTEIISIVFDDLSADVLQRPQNLAFSMALGGFGIYDRTTSDTVYSQIAHVKDASDSASFSADSPFFALDFENNPLDDRADMALSVKLRPMEIIYHRGYVEAIYQFFKPPASQLESVEALLNVASQTLEGIRRDTRAGLEYALQSHKTVDLQMDLSAPIIIIPEDITTEQSRHLVIDAGHIAIESNLADKDAMVKVQSMRKHEYTDADYKRLESLMYDKFTLKLEAAQFLLGNDLASCRKALISKENDALHLLERTNITFQVQNSIIPKALSLAKIKVHGNLPRLQLNVSDAKYKTLMRLIDVTIPRFDDPEPAPLVTVPAVIRSPAINRGTSSAYPFFDRSVEYNVESDSDSEDGDGGAVDQFFDAPTITSGSQRPELHQHSFELEFSVDHLEVAVSKVDPHGQEKNFGNITLGRFALAFALAKYDMQVDVSLRSLDMYLQRPNMEPLRFMSSAEETGSQEKDLLIVKYKRAQREGPEFEALFGGIDQSVDVQISTFNFHAVPEPVISLYNFVMTTFVPPNPEQPDGAPETNPSEGVVAATPPSKPSLIHVLVKLAGVRIALQEDDARIATLSLSTAAVTVLVHANSLEVTGRLGSLSLIDDAPDVLSGSKFKEIMSIEGDNFADFEYKTFDPATMERNNSVSSSFVLNAASIRMNFVEHALRSLYVFLIKLATLKGLYDAATSAAVQRASEIHRMIFHISIKSPIVVFPTNDLHSSSNMEMQLGEFFAKNSYDGNENRMSATLHGLQLASALDNQGRMKMVDNINIDANIISTSNIDRNKESERPDTQVSVQISDVRLHLTEGQYVVLLTLSQIIPRVFANVTALSAEDTARLSVSPPRPPPKAERSQSSTSALIDLGPELRPSPSEDGVIPWNTIDLIIKMNAVKLHLYDRQATLEENRKDHGIARFALNGITLRYKMLSNNASEAELVLKSFTVSNTRPGKTVFREIIPAANHDRNQFMVLFTTSGKSNDASLAIVTIDAPQIIFSMDPVFALINFFTSSPTQAPAASDASTAIQAQDAPKNDSPFLLNFRVDLHDILIRVLEDDTRADSRAISLSIKQILASQQDVMAISVENLGMSLLQMGKDSDSVRFLDDVDMTLSMANRSGELQNMMSIEISSRPITFRASYRDINLILAIVNRALLLATPPIDPSTSSKANIPSAKASLSPSEVGTTSGRRIGGGGGAQVIMAKEQLTANFEGFRVVLIADTTEQPIVHLRVKPFMVSAKDWSGELRATTSFAMQLNYWNLSNSHWEPLIDPWKFMVEVTRENTNSSLLLNLSARDRLDVNVSTIFAELAMDLFSAISKQGQSLLASERGSYAPYRIKNNTGSAIYVWSDQDGSKDMNELNSVHIENGQSVDWRFDDWKTMREHVSSMGQSQIGIQFVGKPWDHLRSIPVDRAGENIFSLRPRLEKYVDRLACDIKVEDNVKVVTLRSTYKIENSTLYPVELLLIDESNHPVNSPQKISPGETYSLPIDAVSRYSIRLQPDQGFGYKWSSAIKWEDLVARKIFTLKCSHSDEREAAFRFHACVETDLNDPNAHKSPKINLKLRAPIELENLLPYNLEYRVYDKNTDQNWRSYLRKGGVMPVHSVELGHLVLLNVAVQDTAFKPSEFAIINADAHSDFDIEKRLSVKDQKDRKIDLRLNYVRYPDGGGAFKVQIYAPYLVVNKTGLPWSVRSRPSRASQPQDVAGETRTDVLSSTAPFLLSSSSDRGHEFTFRVGDSGWSKLVSFEAPSAETALALPLQTQKQEIIHIGMSWTEGIGKYKLSKVITLAPRFFVKNNLSEPISFREYGVQPKGLATLKTGERQGLQFLRNTEARLLTVAFSGLNAEWSPPINMEDIGTVHFRLRHPSKPDEVQLVKADVQVDGPCIFIYLFKADQWPFIIENDSDYPLSFSQTDRRDEVEGSPAQKKTQQYALSAKSSVSYAWDQPAARDKGIQLLINDAKRRVDVLEIGDLVPFKFPVQGGHRAVSLDVRAEGQQQILRISNYSADRSLYKPKRRDTSSLSRSNTLRPDSASSSQEAFEAVTEEVAPTMTIRLNLHGIGISLMNRQLVEVVYLTLSTLKVEYASSPVMQSITVACGSLQLDNQLHDAIFPVVLQPTPIGKEAGGVAALPTVQASLMWLTDQAHGVFFIKYCSILLQALTIEADEDFLFAMYELAQFQGGSWDQSHPDVLIQNPDTVPEPQPQVAGQDLYFEVLELQPIRLTLSFMRTERVSSDNRLSTRNPLAVVINAVTMTLGNVNDAALGMNALAIKDMRLTSSDLQSRVIYHYRQEVLRQLYRILGSADFIGNPIGLFTNVSSGVADIFYEPFNGVVHGNRDIGIGIAKGAASFVKKTVFGVTDSFTKITGSVGKGLSAATMDSDYQLRRRMNQRRNKPRHAIYGVTAGAEAFASSIASGMEGVLMKPIEGAETGGAAGFFKGVGKGLVGVVTKPVIGVFDLASNVSEGIRNTTTVFDNPARDRVRLPRQVRADAILFPWSEREALGQYWMKDLENGRYRKESYVAHLNLPEGDNVAILTATRVLSIWSKRLKLDWDLPFASVQGVTIEDRGIRFAHKSGKEHDKFLYVPDKSSQQWFFTQISGVVKNVNVKRRMDTVS